MSRIRFEDTTPINKGNLDKLNNVVISSTEPTTGEEVWIQKGKNLLDINSIVFNKNVTGDISENTITITVNWQQGDFFGASFELNNLKKNTNYTVSANILINNFKNIYVYTDKLFGTNIATGSLSDGVAFNTGDNTKVVIGLYLTSPTTGNTYSMSNVQVEQGETVTNYEPYVDKKIYVKNDNGVYDEICLDKYNDASLLHQNYIDITPIVGSNYAGYGNSWYYKKGTKVHIHIGVQGLTANTSNQITTLPKGFIPKSPIAVLGVGAGFQDIAYCQINNDGVMTLQSSSTYGLIDVEYDAYC